jgi:uncharacterized membrane protein YozB (DUF420 family)
LRLFVLVGISLTVALGVALSIEHFLDEEHYNPGFYDFPLIISLHVACGGAYLALALFQFAPRIRDQRPDIHRNFGRVAVSFGFVSCLTALAAIVLFPFSGPAMIFFVAPFACYFGFALIRGFLLARQGKYDLHREWMIRAVAIASAIATQRLILVPALIAFGTEPETIRWASMISFTSAFALHAYISELWINRTRKSECAGLS